MMMMMFINYDGFKDRHREVVVLDRALEVQVYGAWQLFVLFSYMEKHQIQLFGRGHIGGIDIKVTMIVFSHYFETNTLHCLS